MESESADTLQLRPVKAYNAPSYPTYSSASANPALLKKLPSRWQGNAKVIACISVLGTVALTGCDKTHHGGSGGSIYVTRLTEQEAENARTNIVKKVTGDNHARVRMHGGGSGGVGYVVYLTEQETYSIIKAEAEAAGLVLDERPFVEYLPFSIIKVRKRHKNAFLIYVDRGRDDLLRSMHSSKIEKAFRKNRQEASKQNKTADGILWKDFLRLLKEQGEVEKTP